MSLLSPTGSTITLRINKTSVPINGTAEITATVIESGGTPVQNGTVVTFTSSFGVVEPAEARTEGGNARVTFTGTQSGTAKIGAFSGGARTATAEELTVKVGSAAAAAATLRAEPTTVPQTGGTVQVFVIIRDEGGTPLPSASVSFTTDQGSLSSSSGITNVDGQSHVFLTTSRDSVVTATVVTGATPVTGTTTIRVVIAPTVTVVCTPPAAGHSVGVAVNCTITATVTANGSPIQNVTVNWGDGTGEQPAGSVTGPTTVSHTYREPATYTVTASATDLNGQRGIGSVAIVVGRILPAITLTVPATGTVGVPVGMSVGLTGTPSQPIANVTIDFGDGTTRNLGPINGTTAFTKTFGAEGGYTVTATATDASGQQSRTSQPIVISRSAPPTVTLAHTSAPANINQPESFTVTVGAAPGASPSIQSVRVTLGDGTEVYSGVSSGSFIYTFPTVNNYSLTARVTDAAGNVGTHVLIVNVLP